MSEEEKTEEVKEEETLAEALGAALDEQEASEEPDKEETPEAPEEPVEAPEEQAEETAEEEEEEKLSAPEHWPLADRELFESQPVDAQKFILDRTKSLEAGYDEKFKEVAGLRKVIEPYQSYLQQIGTTPELAFAAMIDAERILRTGTQQQKQAALQKIINDYGLQQEEPQDDLTDPAVKALESKIDQLQTHIVSQQQGAQTQALETIEQEIQAFRDERTEAGELARPYFGDVMEQMVAMARAETAAGRKPDLKMLYDSAVWANPTVRAKLLEAEVAAKQKKATEAAAEKAQKAEKASSSVSGAPVGSESGKVANLRETLEEVYDKAS